jgi:preprotein translocase subunit SecD
MQVDSRAVLAKRMQGMQTSVRALLVEKRVRFSGLSREGEAVDIRFRDEATLNAARDVLSSQMPELALAVVPDAEGQRLRATLNPEALKKTLEDAVQQNISTLSKRVNELGVAEPVIQRQGADRIVVQLPGVQDVSRAKDIIGRTATLEVRMVDESVSRGMEENAAVPLGSELFKSGKATPVTRTINVVALKDRWLLRSDVDPKTFDADINMQEGPQEAGNQLATVLKKRVDSWGLSLPGGYWSPTLTIESASDAQQSVARLQRLLEGSGIEIRVVPLTIPKQR